MIPVLMMIMGGVFAMDVVPKTDDVFCSAGIQRVRVGGEMGRRIDVTVRNNLMVLDADRDFLKPFRDRKAKDGYIGLGKLIDSWVRLAAYTKDDTVIQRKNEIVEAAIATQEEDGYMGLLIPEQRVWTLWDAHEMSYLVMGLTTDYEFFGSKTSLDAAKKLADYLVTRISAEPDRVMDPTLSFEMPTTGLAQAFLNLSDRCGDARYKDFAIAREKLNTWNLPIVRGRWGKVEGHAYAYMARCLAQLCLYREQGTPELLSQTRTTLDFLTQKNGLVITGTCGDHECWHDSQEGTINLGETCATAYLVRFMDDLLRLTGDARYGDIMERAIFNALFAAQSPDGRHIRYYTPFDGKRTYFEKDTYCCPCNYRRIIGELPGLLYYRAKNGVVVNLYANSEAEMSLNNDTTVSLKQETEYPNTGKVTVHVNPSKADAFSMLLRIPRWTVNPALTINGEAQAVTAKPGEFQAVEREWKPGDRITLEFPMPVRWVKGRVAQAGRAALMRGPMVYCLSREKNPAVKDMDLRLITVDPATVEGPFPDDSVRPGGQACTVHAWEPGAWYPHAKADLKLTLTEFPDPAGEATYFHAPNPNADGFVDDELVQPLPL